MRLSEIRKIIKNNIDKLTYTTEASPVSDHVQLKGIPQVVDAIEHLSELEFLTPMIVRLKSMAPIYTARSPLITVRNADNNNFKAELIEFISHCRTILALSDSVVPPVEENIISIKLLKTANISDVKKLIISLDYIASETSNLPEINGSLKFLGFESGTDWINLLIDGVEYLEFITLLISGAYKIAENYLSLKKLKTECSGMEKLNEGLGDVGNVLKTLAQKTVEKINADKKYNLQPEELKRTALAMKELVGILIDGSIVLASLNAPPEKQKTLKKHSDQLSSQLEELKLLSFPNNDSDSSNDESTE